MAEFIKLCQILAVKPKLNCLQRNCKTIASLITTKFVSLALKFKFTSKQG